jgi:uncharacterized protein (TIGR02271 family)
VDRTRSSHEPVVVGLFAYASDARRALVALRDQRFTSDQVAAAFREQAAAVEDTPQRESSKWFGQLRQIYHEDAQRGDATEVGGNSTTPGFETMLAELPLSPEEARRLNRSLDRGEAIVTVQAGPRNPEAHALLEQSGAHIASGGDRSPAAQENTQEALQAPAGVVIQQMPFIAPAPADPGHIQLLGEVLSVHKEKISSDVQVRKESVTRMETVQVPVTREELVVERPDASGRTAQDALRIPLNEERVHIDKNTVVREEYKVGKREVTHNQSVTDSVRRERLLVDQADTTASD